MKKAITAIAAAAALFAAAVAADAHDYKVGNLEIVHPVARATPPGAPVSGGYMTIRNTGSEADRLVGGSADFAGKVEVHEMAMDGEVMKMRQLEDGLEIPAGGEVVLKPGGYHVMFMQMKDQLKPDTSRKATLVFEKAGEVEVDFHVVTPDELKKQGGEGMDHGHMNHGG